MHVVILYNRVSAHDSAGDLDVLKQVVAVEESLTRLGHSSARVSCHLRLDEMRSVLKSEQPDVVFNLVESLGGTDQLMPLATLLLESMRLPFTGASTLAMLKTTQKLEAKRHLLMFGLPTPAWMTDQDSGWQGLRSPDAIPATAIIKAVAEHSSLGMNDDSVMQLANLRGGDESVEARLAKRIARKAADLGTPHFAEDYIDGREFNLSVLATNSGPSVLPSAEIEFTDFPDDKPKIVGHDAKWNEHTAEYLNTPRRFTFTHGDQPLLDELQSLARRCWEVFGLQGYARVDFRVDADGQPWILEINANPCLSPDAGFAAAVAQAGLTFDTVVERILHDAMR
ncbi:MAG: D-alanine--D-alanine ligase [Fuerstia sp.]|nr:D-alanine--D-alanine ligase [Fuerstiella sp.]